MGDVTCVVMCAREGASDAIFRVQSILSVTERIDVGYRGALVNFAFFTRLIHRLQLPIPASWASPPDKGVDAHRVGFQGDVRPFSLSLATATAAQSVNFHSKTVTKYIQLESMRAFMVPAISLVTWL